MMPTELVRRSQPRGRSLVAEIRDGPSKSPDDWITRTDALAFVCAAHNFNESEGADYLLDWACDAPSVEWRICSTFRWTATYRSQSSESPHTRALASAFRDQAAPRTLARY